MTKREARWVVIHMAHSEEKAQAIRDRLTQEGFMVEIRPAPGDVDGQVFEIMALSSEAREARLLLAEQGL
ncbi:MAG: hypothetical protein IKO07_10630 [Clostridia bacterium]|nr:hypothetical protein [Clostridia bacterium]